MTTLMVAPYAPYRDGIANYTVQEVAARRAAGEDVEVLSPLPSAAHHHLVIGSPQGMVRLLRKVAGFDRLVIQVSPEMLFGSCRSRIERGLVWLVLGQIARRIPTELRVHEIEYGTITCDDVTRTLATRALAAVETVTVHTAAERAALLAAVSGPIGDVDLVQHGKDFVGRTHVSKAEARRSLGVPPGAFVFLSIGFVQRHKGFDRAVRSFGLLDDQAAVPEDRRPRLYVVGDVRVDEPALVSYRDELDRLVESTPGAERRSGYVSDEEFDRWMVAADRLVLPYREIWSSSVIERAALFGLPVIATDVGGLADQAKADTVIVRNDRELTDAMAAAAGVELEDGGRMEVPATRDEMEALIRARAGTATDPLGAPRPSDHLRHVEHAVIGHPDSERAFVRPVKRIIKRMTAWEIEPVARSVNELIAASITATTELEATKVDEPERPPVAE